MEKKNIVLEKTFAFSVRIIKLYQFLSQKEKKYVLSKQILRCGTSIGAKVEEAEGGISRKDFITKMSIAYKEARETNYWLKLLKETEYIDIKAFDSLHRDYDEFLRIFYSIIATSQSNYSLLITNY